MNVIESTINLGIIRNRGGASYLYELANSDLADDQKRTAIKDLVYQAYDANSDEFFDWEQEKIIDTRGVQTIDVIDRDLLYFIFSSLLHYVNWDNILDSHKKSTITGDITYHNIPSGTI